MLNFAVINKICASVLLFAANFSCILIALCTLALAVVNIKVLNQSDQHMPGYYMGDIIIIFVSLIVVAVGVTGIRTAVIMNLKLINLYIGLVFTILILESVTVLYVTMQRYDLQFKVTERTRDDFYQNHTTAQHIQSWDELQTTYKCCGLNGPDDYLVLKKDIPMSCCSRAFSAKGDTARKLMYKYCIDTGTFFKSGCEDKILCMMKSNDHSLLLIVGIAFWFEMLGIFLALRVLRHLGHNAQMYRHTIRVYHYDADGEAAKKLIGKSKLGFGPPRTGGKRGVQKNGNEAVKKNTHKFYLKCP